MPIIRADDLLLAPPVPEPSLIGDGLLPIYGMMLLVGETETGKSVLAFDMALSLILQQPLFGAFKQRHGEEGKPYFPVWKPCRILYLDSELGLTGCYQRLKAFKEVRGIGVNFDDFLTFATGEIDPLLIHDTKFDNGQGYRNLHKLIDETSPDVVILDHLGDFHLMDEDSNLMRVILKGLRYLQHKKKFAAIVLHHESDKQLFTAQGQAIKKEGTGRQRGHSSIAQSVDTMIGVRREDKQSAQSIVKLEWLKVRHGRKPKPGYLLVDFARMLVKWVGPVNKVYPADRQRVVDNYRKENKIQELDD